MSLRFEANAQSIRLEISPVLEWQNLGSSNQKPRLQVRGLQFLQWASTMKRCKKLLCWRVGTRDSQLMLFSTVNFTILQQLLLPQSLTVSVLLRPAYHHSDSPIISSANPFQLGSAPMAILCRLRGSWCKSSARSSSSRLRGGSSCGDRQCTNAIGKIFRLPLVTCSFKFLHGCQCASCSAVLQPRASD